MLDARSYELLDTIKVGRVRGASCCRPMEMLYAANGPSNDVSVVDLAPTRKSRGSKRARVPGAWPSCPIRIEHADAAHWPTMKTSCAVMLRVKPSLKARARSTAGP